jgi:hypothetical protein
LEEQVVVLKDHYNSFRRSKVEKVEEDNSKVDPKLWYVCSSLFLRTLFAFN